MPSRYVSEFGLAMELGLHHLVQPAELNELEKTFDPNEPPFHIYMVGSIPRMAIRPDECVVEERGVSIVVTIADGGKEHRERINLAHPIGRRIDRVESDWPHGVVSFMSGAERVWGGKVPFLAKALPSLQPHFVFDVLYVGQAFGADGKRCATDRLRSHSTLQQILAEVAQRRPDKEIWLLLCRFNELLLTSFDGTVAKTPGAIEADAGRLERVLDHSFAEDQLIAVTEAALINFFQPPYNKMFRAKFPSVEHTSYSDCFKLDLNSVWVALNTTDLELQLHSDATGAASEHVAKFQFHRTEDRLAMFSVLTPPKA